MLRVIGTGGIIICRNELCQLVSIKGHHVVNFASSWETETTANAAKTLNSANQLT